MPCALAVGRAASMASAGVGRSTWFFQSCSSSKSAQLEANGTARRGASPSIPSVSRLTPSCFFWRARASSVSWLSQVKHVGYDEALANGRNARSMVPRRRASSW